MKDFKISISWLIVLVLTIILVTLGFAGNVYSCDPLEKVRPKVCNSTFVWRDF